jgi:hypothetical protein
LHLLHICHAKVSSVVRGTERLDKSLKRLLKLKIENYNLPVTFSK